MDYIPPKNNEFNTFQSNFMEYAEPRLAKWKIAPENFDPLKPLQTAWEDAWDEAKKTGSRSQSDVAEKDKAREDYEKALRDFIQQYMVLNKLVTNKQRTDMKIPIYDTTKQG